METTCKYTIFAIFLVQCLIPSSLGKNLVNFTTDQSALLAFKSQITSDPNKILAKSWIPTSSICDWIGITCSSRHQRVTALDVSNMNLSGTISPHLGNLSFLVNLNLSFNNFHENLLPDLARLHRLKVLDFGINDFDGELPNWLGSFTELQFLSLRNNSFSGLIPDSISNMSKLEQLILSSNSLQGRIPKGIGNLGNLLTLAVNFNQLSDSLPLEIFNLSSLERLALVGNQLSGTLPTNLCDRFQKLQFLLLSVNNLHGRIPSNVSQCSQLQALSLSVNNFSGFIPKEIGNLKQLQLLYMGLNKLSGVIPKEIGNLTMLQVLSIPRSGITGTIPWELVNLFNLQELVLANNRFLTGSIPEGIFNISSLQILSLANNSLEGNLPTTIGYGLPMLQFLQLGTNNLSGIIPGSVSNLSQLMVLELHENRFTGFIPGSLGNLQFLERILLSSNLLRSDSSNGELDFITSLTNCRNLIALGFNGIRTLNGKLPDSFGNFSASIERIYGYNSNIQGRIPESVGNLSSLLLLSLYGNHLTGPIPMSIGRMQNLQGLYLYDNKLSGSIPRSLCELKTLYSVYCDTNKISGPIPECLRNVSALRYLYLESNRLSSNIPSSLWQLKDLLELNLSTNSLTGSLSSEVGNLEALTTLDLSVNKLSGEIPGAVGELGNLNYFSFAENQFQGSIPEPIGKMVSLQTLDLSNNNLSGSIPISLEKLQYLSYFNVSFNKLRGKIPTGGPFENFTSESFISNEALCGPVRFQVPPCPKISKHKSKTTWIVLILVGIIAIVGALAIGLVYLGYRRKKDTVSNGDTLSTLGAYERISYYELSQATDGYDKDNLLGSGGFGSVYCGTLKDGRKVAVKVFHVELERALKSFDTECEVLRNLRHRNLTKVISGCSNHDFKALVLELMPNGSLEKWLHSPDFFLDMKQRLNIMIDVANALVYLHNGYSTPVVHCDLKPSNVLLDQDMNAHVSDFGIAKLLSDEDDITRTATIATIGYIAPEFGLEGLVSTKCDVYSFGIMLMEVFTRIKPNDDRFNGNFSLKDLVQSSLPNDLYQIIDANLLQEGEEHSEEKLNCISSIMEIALNCSKESSKERSNMETVLVEINNVKSKLFIN